uniref:Uncharacterized protein n=1 Tax=Panagrolaimus sp. ES5 TaxID=591445 RepID=A0AC34FEG0_9BILA
MFTIYSSKDKKEFEVTDKVMEASTLLKNLCEITDINEGISVECLSDMLSLYIKLIGHYETAILDIHDRNFEKALFKKITKKQLEEFAKELCYLDSDFFIDTVADEILDQIKKKDVKGITTYLGLKDDFSPEERKKINDNLLEYILFGRNYPNCPHFTLIPNKFYSTFNVLLARIVKKSQGYTSLKISLINKTLKVESDRFPIKLSTITIADKW